MGAWAEVGAGCRGKARGGWRLHMARRCHPTYHRLDVKNPFTPFALGSPIGVRSSEASGFSSPDSANHRPARVGVNKSLFGARHILHQRFCFFVFAFRWSPRVNLGCPSSMMYHATSCLAMSAMFRLHVMFHTSTRSRSRRTTPSPSWPSAFRSLALVHALRASGYHRNEEEGCGRWGPSP